MEKPNYYAIIPAHVRYSEVSANAKLLYGEITALSSKEGFCWATNKYFGDLYGVGAKAVSDWISELREAGFITYTIENMNTRRIFLVGVPSKDGGGYRQKTDIVLQESITNNSAVAEPPAIKDIPIGKDEPRKRPSTAKYPNALEVFSLWGANRRKAWENPQNARERQAAQNLFEEHGIEEIQNALKWYEDLKDRDFCPQIFSPYDLDTKWAKLEALVEKA